MSRAHPERRTTFRWRAAGLVLLLALASRGLFLLEDARQPDFRLFYMDEEYNLEWGRSLATGEWSPPYDRLQGAPFFRAPLYSYGLAGVLRLFGPGTVLPRALQLLLGSLSCLLAYALAARVWSERVGIATGVICAMDWVLIYFDGQLLLPVLLVFLGLMGFLLTFLTLERGSPRLAGAAGLAFGLFATTRPNILAFLPLLLWWAAGTIRRLELPRGRALLVLLALGCFLPPALVTLRNRTVGGDWVVVASQGGVNFFIGNNPRSNGMQAVVPGTRRTWWGGYEDTVALAEEADGRSLKPSEVSRYWYRQAWAYMIRRPGHWAGLTARKALAFAGSVEVGNNAPYEARRTRYASLRYVPLGFGLLFGLFLASLPIQLGARGLPSGRGPPRSLLQERFARLLLLFVLVYALTVIAFFVTGRYRVPLIPFVAMGASVTVWAVVDWLRTGRRRAATVLAAAGILLAVLLSVDHLGIRAATRGFTRVTDALDLLAAGDTDGAIQGLEAVLAEGAMPEPDLYATLARLYVQRDAPGDQDALLRVAEAGQALAPRDAELLWYAAAVRARRGEWDQAVRWIEPCLAERPEDPRILHLAASAALARGRPDEARIYLARIEALDPEHPMARELRARLNGGG